MSADKPPARSDRTGPSGQRSRPGQRSGEQLLIQRLRALPPGPEPDVRFKADLRAQLVAITARVVAETAEAEGGLAPRRRARLAGAGFLGALRRPLLAVTSAAAVLVMLLGLAVFVSHGSLPGQSLYGVKRASENVQLSVAGNDTDKGSTYLQLAGNRAKEVSSLLGGASAGNPASSHAASLVADTLGSADADTRSGSQLLGRAAVTQVSAQPLIKLSGWIPVQRARLTSARDKLGSGAPRNRLQASINLLQQVADRAAALRAKMGCACLSLAHSDSLGPVPCSVCAPAVPGHGPGLPTSAPSGLPTVSSGGTTGSVPTSLPSLPGLGGSSPRAAGGPGSATGGGSAGLPVAGSALPTGVALPGASGVPSPPAGVATTLPGGIGLSVGSGGVSASVPVPAPSLP